MLKRPAAGDFRVQRELGGSEAALEPPPALLVQARAVTARIPGSWLYARVDGIDRGGVLTLLELELIEPVLFLGMEVGAARRFASAILAASEHGVGCAQLAATRAAISRSEVFGDDS